MVSLPMILVQSSSGDGDLFPDIPSLGDLGSSLANAITSASEDFTRTVVESFIQPVAEIADSFIRFIFTWIILPPQPYTSAQYLDGVSVHGDGPKGSLNMANHGCQPGSAPANPGNYRSIWESMYCLNDTFTEIALTIFGGAFIIYLIALGIGWVNIENMAESLWTVTLTFIFVVANEEILGLGWAAVYALSDAIIQADLTNESYTLVGAVISMVLGGLGASGAGGGAGVATGFSFLSSIGTLSTGIVVGVGIFIGLMILVVMVFLLIMFFVQMIAMIGYGIFPILALLIGLGEIFDSFQGKAQKFTGLFIPAMWSPILFAIVFKISTAFVVVGGFGQGSGIDDFAISTMMGIGTLFVGTWMALKQFKAGQMAVGAATTAITTAATAGVVAATSASAGSALKGAAYGGPKGALAGAAGDAMGGNASAPMEDPQEGQDQYDDVGEDIEENEEDLEDERDLEEFGDEAEPDPDEKSRLGKLKEKASEINDQGEGRTIMGESKKAYEGTKDGYEGMKEGLSDRFGGDEDERADLEKKEHNESALGEDGTGHATGKEIGKDAFNNDKQEVAEEIEDGNIDGADAIEGVAAHRADMMGKKGEDKGEFIESAKQAYNKSVRENKNPANTWEEAQAEAFDEHMDSMTESMQASAGNAGVLYGNDFDQKWGVSRSNVMRDMDNREARQAMAADPTAGVGQDEIENHDAETVHLTDQEFGGEAASDRGVHARSMDKAIEEEGAEEAIEEIGEAKSFEDGTVGVGMSEKAEGSVESVIDDEILERSVQDDKTGLYKMSPEDARKASSQIASEAKYSGQGLTADREASVLMDESARRNKRNEAMISARREANGYDRFDTFGDKITSDTIMTNYPESQALDDNPEAGITDTGKAGSLKSNKVRITGETEKGGSKASALNYRATTDIPEGEYGNASVVADWDEETGAKFNFDSPQTTERVKQLAEDNLSEKRADKVLSELDGLNGSTLSVANQELQNEVVEMMANDGMVVDAERGAAISFEQGTTAESVGSPDATTTIRQWDEQLEPDVGNTSIDPDNVVTTGESTTPSPLNNQTTDTNQKAIRSRTAGLRVDTPDVASPEVGEIESRSKNIAKRLASNSNVKSVVEKSATSVEAVKSVIDSRYNQIADEDVETEQIVEEIIETEPTVEQRDQKAVTQTVETARMLSEKAEQSQTISQQQSTTPQPNSSTDNTSNNEQRVELSRGVESYVDVKGDSDLQTGTEEIGATIDKNIDAISELVREKGAKNVTQDDVRERISMVDTEHLSQIENEIRSDLDPQLVEATDIESHAQNEVIREVTESINLMESVETTSKQQSSSTTPQPDNNTPTSSPSPSSTSTQSVTPEDMTTELRKANGDTVIRVDEESAEQAAKNITSKTDITDVGMDNRDQPILEELDITKKESLNSSRADSAKRAIRHKIVEISDNTSELPYETGRNAPGKAYEFESTKDNKQGDGSGN